LKKKKKKKKRRRRRMSHGEKCVARLKDMAMTG
jgi:hypothetical protein